MKDSDYIVTLAPMKTKLKLKGQALDLFALIYGYSKDGESTCRASLTYLAEWLDTDRHAVSKLIKRLVDAGYINRIEYLRDHQQEHEHDKELCQWIRRFFGGIRISDASIPMS